MNSKGLERMPLIQNLIASFNYLKISSKLMKFSKCSLWGTSLEKKHCLIFLEVLATTMVLL